MEQRGGRGSECLEAEMTEQRNWGVMCSGVTKGAGRGATRECCYPQRPRRRQGGDAEEEEATAMGRLSTHEKNGKWSKNINTLMIIESTIRGQWNSGWRSDPLREIARKNRPLKC